MGALTLTVLVTVVPALVSVVIGGIVAPLIANPIIDRYRKQDTIQLDALRSQQRRFESDMATRYSLLHTKRAEMIVNLYSSVYDLQTTLQGLVNPLVSESDEAFNAHKHAEWRAVTDASVQFDRLAKTSAIFFHDDSVTEAAEAIGHFVGDKLVALFEANLGNRVKTVAELEQVQKTSDLSALHERIIELKLHLRRDLGANDAWTPTRETPSKD